MPKRLLMYWCLTVFSMIFSALALPSKAQEFTPLDKVIVSENSDWNTMYVFQRCAAVHSAIVHRMASSGRNDVVQLIEGHELIIKYWVNLIVKQAEKLGVSDMQDDLTKRTIEMTDVYSKLMDESYTLTGNAVSGTFKDDLRTCDILRGN